MKKIGRIINTRGFQIWFCVVCLAAFTWPVLTSREGSLLIFTYKYIFAAWGVVVILLFFISRFLKSETGKEDGGDSTDV
jgi:hypothetical protein